MNRKISVNLAITIAIIAMTVTFSITIILAMQMFDNTVSSVNEKEQQYAKLSELDRYVRANEYYEIKNDTLNDMLGSGYVLGTGDRNARYYTAKSYTELLDIQSGKLVGIGVEAMNDSSSGYARITKVYADSPASELGMVEGGYITRINDVDVKTLTSSDAITAALRGEAGTSVSITYLGLDMTETAYEVTRRSYAVPTVISRMLGTECGYIDLSDFNESTGADFSYGVNRLISGGAKYLVIDLRGTSSTDLDEALRCADTLVPEGDMALIEYRNGTREVLGSSDESSCSVPVVCVVDNATANAAELLAAVVRQAGNGRIVGDRTAGKGVVMSQPHRMSDGSAVVITTGKLIMADESSFDGVGLTLDNETSLNQDELPFAGESVEDSDTQIRKAVEVAANMLTNTGTAEAAQK